jgi:hypothetical protein
MPKSFESKSIFTTRQAADGGLAMPSCGFSEGIAARATNPLKKGR